LKERFKVTALTSRRTDVTDMDTLKQSFAQVEQDFGRIDNWLACPKFFLSMADLKA
jgi:NAD(P)-dependent dehydrogenase (short-subunit alcohol dehydrogenase family)